MSLGQRVYPPSLDEEFESRTLRRCLEDAERILFGARFPKSATDNLRIDSRRCAIIFTLPTGHVCPGMQAAFGFSRICDCDSKPACYFCPASVAREFSVGGCHELVRDKERRLIDCRLVQFSPKRGGGFATTGRYLNFVSCVGEGRPEVAVCTSAQ